MTFLLRQVTRVLARLSTGLLIGLLGAPPLIADVRFVHQAVSDEMFLGTKEAEWTFSYLPAALYVEKETRFTGSWMKRFFGKEKLERVATAFLMDQDQIRETDWQNRRIYVFDLEKMDRLQWIKDKRESFAAVSEHLKNRYQVKEPQLSIEIVPGEVALAGHACQRVLARLRLETVDRLKQASSITLVDQELWLSRHVPGYDVYLAFHSGLAGRLGIEAQRLGPLTYLLRYWSEPLTSIQDTLSRLQGYPVRSSITVTAQYVTGIDTDAPRTLEKRLKTETVQLSAISQALIDTDRFKDPDQFEIIHPE